MRCDALWGIIDRSIEKSGVVGCLCSSLSLMMASRRGKQAAAASKKHPWGRLIDDSVVGGMIACMYVAMCHSHTASHRRDPLIDTRNPIHTHTTHRQDPTR